LRVVEGSASDYLAVWDEKELAEAEAERRGEKGW
jgi:hypothetical protein